MEWEEYDKIENFTITIKWNYSKHILYCIEKLKRVVASIRLQIVDCNRRDKLAKSPEAIDQWLYPNEAHEQLPMHASNNVKSMVHPKLVVQSLYLHTHMW